MKNKSFIAVVCLLILNTNILCAQLNGIKPLNVGDTVTDGYWYKTINYPDSNIKISDFKGKLVILDFWSTTCSSCIASFPKLEKLQEKYKDRLMVLLVTSYKSKAYNEEFFNKRLQMGRPISLPSVVEGAVLRDLFPGKTVPRIALIDENGIFIGSPNYLYVDEPHIKALLDGKRDRIPQQTYPKNFDACKPLLAYGNGGQDDAFLYRSMVTAYNDSIENISFRRQQTPGFTRLFIGNSTPQSLFQEVYAAMYANDSAFVNRLFDKSIVTETPFPYQDWPDVLRTSYEEMENYKRKNLFCYELILPPSFSIKEALQQMAYDLDRFFHVHSVVKETMVPCLALLFSPGGSFNKPISTEPLKVRIETEKDHFSISCRNITAPVLAGVINRLLKLPLVLDKTGSQMQFDLDLKLKKDSSLSDLRAVLTPLGFSVATVTENLRSVVLMEQ